MMIRLAALYYVFLRLGFVVCAHSLPANSHLAFECTTNGNYPIMPDTCSGDYYFCFDGSAYIQVLQN